MAAYEPAVARIKFLVTGEGSASVGPRTISGGCHTIYSYALPIVEIRGTRATVYAGKSTRTTNRHINAARMALTELGFTIDGVR